MSMKLIFTEWPEGDGQITEVWFTKLEGPGMITQASLEFDQQGAEQKAAAINAELPGLATVLGPYVLRAQGDDDCG